MHTSYVLDDPRIQLRDFSASSHCPSSSGATLFDVVINVAFRRHFLQHNLEHLLRVGLAWLVNFQLFFEKVDLSLQLFSFNQPLLSLLPANKIEFFLQLFFPLLKKSISLLDPVQTVVFKNSLLLCQNML